MSRTVRETLKGINTPSGSAAAALKFDVWDDTWEWVWDPILERHNAFPMGP